MKQKDLIATVVKRIKENDYSYQIKKYLASKGLSEEKQDEILAEAKLQIRNEKLRKLPVQHKITFYIFLSLTIVTFVFFVFLLPNYNIYNSSNFYAVIGTILFVAFGMFTLIYKRKQLPENIDLEADGKFKIDYSAYGILAIFPIVILVFLLIWRYSHTEDAILKETQVRTIGTIVSGISTSSRSYNSSTVIVEFTTLDGKKMSVKEEVGFGEFRKFYKGQRVSMIYSSKFPAIIELLTNKNDIRDFTDNTERDIIPGDLIAILSNELVLTEESLNKISFGWRFDEKTNVWANETKNDYLNKTRDQVIYITNLETAHAFSKKLKKAGFEKMTLKKDGKGFEKLKAQNIQNRIGGVGIYQSDDHLLEITRKREGKNTFIGITMVKR